MDRRSLTFTVALAASITLSCIPITALQNDGPPNAAKLEANRNSKGAKTDGDKAKTQPIPTAIARTPIPTNSQPRPDPKTDPPKTKGERFTEWLWGFVTNQQTFSNLLLVIVGGGAFAIGLGTLFTIKRQTTEFKRSAEATERSAATAELALKAVERAYVISEDFEILEWMNPIRVKAGMTNIGKTPAMVLLSNMNFTVGKIQDLPKEPEWKHKFTNEDMPLYPDQPKSKQPKLHISDADFTALKDGTKELMIWGVIYYQDAFRKMRYTRFSAHYIHAGAQGWKTINKPGYNEWS